jgi:ABC-2 type transport system ATP-binding protein
LNTILSIQGLNKRYGKIHAVNNLTFEIEKGNVYGILGPNGSGKTTTLSIILGVVSQDSGSFLWFGKPASPEIRKRIGAILEHPIFYPYMSAEDNLKIIADIKGVDAGDIERVLKTVELYDRKDSKFKTFSYGMKQRLAIAGALLGNPEVLIFDEPTNGLDPKGIAEIRELIIDIAKQGITIILASHLLDEVQKTCTHVLVLNKGQKLFAGKVDEVLNVAGTIEIASDDLEKLQFALNGIDFISNVKQEGDILTAKIEAGKTMYDLNKILVENEIIVTHLTKRKRSLEKQFLELVSENQ